MKKLIKNRVLIVNRIQTPDGTFLTSRSNHDFVSHQDKNGLTYFLDGGLEYRRFSNHFTPKNKLKKISIFFNKLFLNKEYVDPISFRDFAIYLDDPFEKIRQHFERGGRGKSGKETLKWVPLCEMSNSWLKNCIKYNNRLNKQDCIPNTLYKKELDYRSKNGIFIEDYNYNN